MLVHIPVMLNNNQEKSGFLLINLKTNYNWLTNLQEDTLKIRQINFDHIKMIDSSNLPVIRKDKKFRIQDDVRKN